MRRHLVTKGSFYERLADHGDELVSDEDFARCYSPTHGRPSIPPSVMMRALLCAANDRISSDAETSRRTRVDADWKAAMGVDDDFEGIAPRTFSLFRARLVLHDGDEAILRRTVEKAVAAGVLGGKVTALIDSTPVHGAGAVADTYELVRKLAAKVARVAGDDLDPGLATRARALGAAKPDIDWDDAEGRRGHLDELVSLTVALLAAVGASDDPAVAEAADLLATAVDQDVELDEDRKARLRHGVAPDRVVSHSDPEMRHGRKSASRRFDGHKA
ncbi:MAG: transposase, partial [Actinomycetota bacterium]|nr:transposase [Actinomycetota bacterium]